MFGKELLQPGLEHSMILPEENSNSVSKVISGEPCISHQALQNRPGSGTGETMDAKLEDIILIGSKS